MDILEIKKYAELYGSRNHSGFLLFFRIFIFRCFFLTYSIVFLLFFLLKNLNASYLTINLCIGFFAVFIEEQSRWVFARYSRSIKYSQIQFSVMAIIIETVGYFPYAHSDQLSLYFASRLGSILVHVLNGYFCFVSYKISYSNRIIIFAGAIIFHLYMNIHGSLMVSNLITKN